MIPLNHLHDDNFIHEFRMAENPYQKFVLVVDLFCNCYGPFEIQPSLNEFLSRNTTVVSKSFSENLNY